MKKSVAMLGLGLTSLLFQSQAMAEQWNTTVGTGWPYAANLQFSKLTADHRYFLNLGVGADTGVSLGWEKLITPDNKQGLGVVIGAIGVKKASESGCDADAVLCLSDLFDEESLYGVGASYSYAHHGFDKAGFRMNLIAGYGESITSRDADGLSASLTIGYAF